MLQKHTLREEQGTSRTDQFKDQYVSVLQKKGYYHTFSKPADMTEVDELVKKIDDMPKIAEQQKKRDSNAIKN